MRIGNAGRIRRHMLGMGPAPLYKASRVISKDHLEAEAPRLMRRWQNATTRKAPATVYVEEVDLDNVRLTMRFDRGTE